MNLCMYAHNRLAVLFCESLELHQTLSYYALTCITFLRARVRVRSCDGYSIRELVRDMGCNVTHTGRYGNDVCARVGGAGEEE